MSARQDLANMKFGEWTALYYAGNSSWHCECSCGTKKDVKTQYLISGRSKSCGHNTNKFKVLTGLKFGDWNVIEYVGNQKWKCQCSCGTIKEVEAYYLTSGKSKSCGHNTNGANTTENIDKSFKDLTGQQFGEWKVIRYLGKSMWECECSCGKIVQVHRYSLITQKSLSCGHKLVNDLTGQKFGRLVAKKYMGRHSWLCQCDCGNTTIVLAHNLRNDEGTRSCGCIKNESIPTKEIIISRIEEYIKIHNEKPYLEDLCQILNRKDTAVRKYIVEFELDKYINKTFKSKYEREIASYFDNVRQNDRSVFHNNIELDLYIKEMNLAIEFNGSYWHSELQKDKYYHQNKTIECAKRRIRLIHIFEYEWLDKIKKEKIVKLLERIRDNNKINRIYARKTEIKQIDSSVAKGFLEKYHLQNYTQSSINMGMYYNAEIIGVMTFSKPRFNNNYQYELVRLCYKDGVIVIGGTEKMFKNFVTNYNPQSIITYCDISKFTGNSYTKIDFHPIQPKPITEPNYVWVEPYKNIVLTRYQAQKHKLIEQGLGTEDQTEAEIMHNLGFFRVYDSGNIVLHWMNKSNM